MPRTNGTRPRAQCGVRGCRVDISKGETYRLENCSYCAIKQLVSTGTPIPAVASAFYESVNHGLDTEPNLGPWER